MSLLLALLLSASLLSLAVYLITKDPAWSVAFSAVKDPVMAGILKKDQFSNVVIVLQFNSEAASLADFPHALRQVETDTERLNVLIGKIVFFSDYLKASQIYGSMYRSETDAGEAYGLTEEDLGSTFWEMGDLIGENLPKAGQPLDEDVPPPENVVVAINALVPYNWVKEGTLDVSVDSLMKDLAVLKTRPLLNCSIRILPGSSKSQLTNDQVFVHFPNLEAI